MFKKNTFFYATMLFSCLNLNCQIPSSQRAEASIETQEQKMSAALKSKGLSIGHPIFIRIFKETKELELWVQKKDCKKFVLFKTYPICTYGSQGLGPKLKEGDNMAPEGFYFVPKSKLNPNSTYHLSFNLSYPNKYDEAHKRTGSALMVHGGCASVGCYAMTDPAIEEIYSLAYMALKNGQKFFRVHCFPFRMTEKNMNRHKDSKWIVFWNNLKEGYDYFEKNQFPPDVKILDKRYVIQ